MSEKQSSYYGIDFAKNEIQQGITSGFIDAEVKADAAYEPQFLVNTQNNNVLNNLLKQLDKCDSFDFAVAFITTSGVQVLIEALNKLKHRGIKGRVLTSTFQNFNEPAALKKLLEFENIDLRVYQGPMHVKGYIFSHENYATVIVGSSNLTQYALTKNKEWNVLYHSMDKGSLFQSTCDEFDELWESPETCTVDEGWIEEYARYKAEFQLKNISRGKRAAAFKRKDEAEADLSVIKPNRMQQAALKSLAAIHSNSTDKSLLVSATGSGKTYLSALDVQSYRPSKVLYVAHRVSILEKSRESFERVLGTQYSYSSPCFNKNDKNATCQFKMVSTLSKHLDEYKPDEYDYIIIDEAHRSAAHSYQEVIKYFKPKFYLGMTATPSRTDGKNVYEIFDHNIAYFITLRDAMENDLLAPFHYFGIADIAIDDEVIDDPSNFSRLTSEDRIKHVIQKINQYTIDRENRKGLIFCNRVEEAEAFSEAFNKCGFRTKYLSGAHSESVRQVAIDQLEKGQLDYLFSVDIFNEGVDIPSVNQIIMLRRTDSPIVFTQQLGRGLRKAKNKEYTLVLDFIGNYKQSYLTAVALSGDNSYNKDKMRRIIKTGATCLPGCSTITFDAIAEKRIFDSLDAGKMSSAENLKQGYCGLKEMLGRIPRLIEFDKNNAIDPLLIISKYGSYYSFLKKYDKDFTQTLSSEHEEMLKFASKNIATGKRLDDIALLKLFIKRKKTTYEEIEKSFTQEQIPYCRETIDSAIRTLSGVFAKTKTPLIRVEKDSICVSEKFEQALSEQCFIDQLEQLIEFAESRNTQLYANKYRDTQFVLDAKYTYEEVCKLLNWEKNITALNIGGYKYDKQTNTFPVFINYEKDPNVQDTIKYADRFVSNKQLVAISKSGRSLESSDIQRLKNHSDNQMKCYLFVRKNKDDKESKEFYFLGEMEPTGMFEEISMPNTDGKTAVEIGYRLADPVRDDIYEYLTNDLDASII